jgi:hypothetical protein
MFVGLREGKALENKEGKVMGSGMFWVCRKGNKLSGYCTGLNCDISTGRAALGQQFITLRELHESERCNVRICLQIQHSL